MDYREVLEERIQDTKAILDEHYPEWRDIDPDSLNMESRSACIGGHLRGDYRKFIRELSETTSTDYFVGGVLNREDDGNVYHGLGYSEDLLDRGVSEDEQFDYINSRWKEILSKDKIEV